MRLISYTIKIIIALYLAKFVSRLVIAENITMFMALLAGGLFLFSPWKYKFVLFSISAFYPFFIPGKVFFINTPDWIMIIAPLTCMIFIIELAVKKQALFSRKAGIFFAAVGVLSLWAVVNYLKNPVFGQQLTGASAEQGGLKSYFILFVGVATFLCSYWFFRYKKINVNKWLVLLLGVSLFLGILRIISYFLEFKIPFLGGTFAYLFYADLQEGASFRIGGLSEAATIGLSGLLGLFYRKKWNKMAMFLFTAFIAMIVLAGGRGTFIGVVLALLIYVSVINRKYLVPSILSVLILAGVYVVVFPNVKLHEGKAGRVLSFTDEDLERQKTRVANTRIFFEFFMDNPVFGKGIGYNISKYEGIDIEKDLERGAEGNITKGGHGAYMSILGIFGMGGVFFLAVILFGSMYYAYKIFKCNTDYGNDDTKLAIFAFIRLIIMSLAFIPGGDGYSDMKLWFIAGMIAAIIAKDNVTNVEFR